jgi:hypothetical protein
MKTLLIILFSIIVLMTVFGLYVEGNGYFTTGLVSDAMIKGESLSISEEQSTVTGTTATEGGIFRVGTDNKPYFVSDYSDGNQVYDLSGTVFTKSGDDIYYDDGEVMVGTSSDLGSFTLQAYSTTQNALTGQSTSGTGVSGFTSQSSGIGTLGSSSGSSGIGVRGQATGTSGMNYAGEFIATASTDGVGVKISASRSHFLLDLDSVDAPSSSTDTGTAGEVRVTTNYIYVCVATDTWKRIALST